jgi:hypothetical protein
MPAPAERAGPAPGLAARTVAAAALASIAGNAMAQENQDYARDLTAEQTAIYTTRAPATRQPNAPGVPKGLDGLRGATMMLLLRSQTDQPTALSVAAWVDHPDGTYAVGEQVRLFILTSRDAYVTVIKVGASGRTTVLFPNRFQTDNLVRGNTVMEVPDPSSNAKITVAEPVGAKLIKVIASTERVTLFDATQLVQAGAFTTVRATPSRVARDLQVTMASWSYVQWDDYNKVILTVAENHAAAAGAPAIGEFPSQPFALQVATDKQLYRVGDAGSATRNLSVVANRPDDETAIETIGFVVVQ